MHIEKIMIIQIFIICIFSFVFIVTMHSFRQHGQDTKEEVASRDLRTELESNEREAREKKEGKTRSFTG